LDILWRQRHVCYIIDIEVSFCICI